MSTVISLQPPKENEEEDEDEEQGEEFVFDDSTDEEKHQEDSKGIGSDSVRSVHVSKNEDSETSDSVSQTPTDSTQLPPAGQEDSIPTKDLASVSTADVPVSESPSWASAAAAEPSTSNPCVGEELRGLPVAPAAVEALADSRDQVTEAAKESLGSRDIPEAPCAAEAESHIAEASEVIYDDVPSEDPVSPDEDMIYEDVQRGGGPVDADHGWSSSEFESYDEQSDNETKVPTKSKLSPEVRRLRERCARTKRELAMRLSGKHNYDIKVYLLQQVNTAISHCFFAELKSLC
uniref:rho guanine nucleotide exchange factor 10-like protein n=1 Tax=Monopterus albus TaxID=43700 RepID=UPI0009B4CBC7|nr:rho guanine nucleotide exchange factor 10-like protein [Monopterus albus]